MPTRLTTHNNNTMSNSHKHRLRKITTKQKSKLNLEKVKKIINEM